MARLQACHLLQGVGPILKKGNLMMTDSLARPSRMILAAVWSVSLVAMAVVATRTSAVEEKAPIVVAAEVPFYPKAARAMGWMGSINLSVATDGEKVTTAIASDGPNYLRNAAIENVKTWRFEKHSPCVFQVQFQYILYDSDTCSGNSDVEMHFPNRIKIRAPGLVLMEEKQGN